MSPRKKLVSDSPKVVKAIVAACDVVPEAVANPVTLDCVLTIRLPADDERVEKAFEQYQNGSLVVNVSAYERAERIVGDVLREAKRTARDAHADDPQVQIQILEERKARQVAEASQPNAFTVMRQQQADFESKSLAKWQAGRNADVVNRWEWERSTQPKRAAKPSDDVKAADTIFYGKKD